MPDKTINITDDAIIALKHYLEHDQYSKRISTSKAMLINIEDRRSYAVEVVRDILITNPFLKNRLLEQVKEAAQ